MTKPVNLHKQLFQQMQIYVHDKLAKEGTPPWRIDARFNLDEKYVFKTDFLKRLDKDLVNIK